MQRYVIILFVLCGVDLHGQQLSDKQGRSFHQLQKQLDETQMQVDSLKSLLNDKRDVALLQERALFQKITLDRQRRFILVLGLISSLLITSVVLLIRSIKKQKKAHQLLALKSLRTQMNPHFVFNALNSINGFISNRQVVEANRYLTDFASLTRLVMENLQNDFVTLGEEIQVLKLYLQLEHVRFADSFSYQFNIDTSIDVDMLKVPPMLLQPYIENAIWHGLRHKVGKGELLVEIQSTETFLLLKVHDNGIGRSASQEQKTIHQKQHKSTGMTNTANRISGINAAYHSSIEVSIEDAEASQKTGTKVLIKIPLSLAENDKI